MAKKKIKNRKNKNRNEKQNIWEIVIEELNWEKKNKTSIKEIRKKLKIKRTRTKIEKQKKRTSMHFT